MKVGCHIAKRFAKCEKGAVLVEFALVMPVMLLLFAATVESARMFWAFQQTISGVRDASRFFGRAANLDICPPSSAKLAPWAVTLQDIVENKYRVGGTGPAVTVFGGSVTVLSVVPTVNCINDSGEGGFPDLYAADTVAIGTVTANVRIDFPFGNVLRLFGDGLSSVTTAVTDQVRIYGQ